MCLCGLAEPWGYSVVATERSARRGRGSTRRGSRGTSRGAARAPAGSTTRRSSRRPRAGARAARRPRARGRGWMPRAKVALLPRPRRGASARAARAPACPCERAASWLPSRRQTEFVIRQGVTMGLVRTLVLRQCSLGIAYARGHVTAAVQTARLGADRREGTWHAMLRLRWQRSCSDLAATGQVVTRDAPKLASGRVGEQLHSDAAA
jgi:hypothetical protein